MLLHVARSAWKLALAATPGPVIRRLDAWAQRHAQQRALRRRQLAAARQR